MKDLIIIEEKNNKLEFVVKLSQEIAHAIKIYCETIEVKPEQFIRDAIMKDLIRTYVDLQREDYIYKFVPPSQLGPDKSQLSYHSS